MASKKRVKVKKLVASTIETRRKLLCNKKHIYKMIGQTPRLSV